MRLVSFRVGAGEERIGVLIKDRVVDLHSELASVGEAVRSLSTGIYGMIDFLSHRAEYLELVRHILSRMEGMDLATRSPKGERVIYECGEVKILAPVIRPPKIICLGLNYESHVKEGGFSMPEKPILFLKPHTTVIGHDDYIVIPASAKKIDYEIELAVVIGRKGKNISTNQVYDFVAGYTIFNDVSSRDLPPPTLGGRPKLVGSLASKGVDTFGPMGPYLVTKEEVPDPHNLRLALRVNGEVRQQSNTREMIFKIPELIEYISSIVTLECGDIISTGTPAGLGIAREQHGEVQKLLKPGDVIECEIEGIGLLRNFVTKSA